MKKRKLIALGIVAAVVLGTVYLLVVHDSPINIYKKLMVRSYAKDYISESYPDFELEGIDISFDRALRYYIADCKSEDYTITLNYSTSLFMEFDCYYNEKYTAAAVKYQKEMESRLTKALKNQNLSCDTVTVYVDLDAGDKQKIVYEGKEIENERIDCIITYVRKEGDRLMDKYQFAEFARKVSSCIYGEIDASARINTLKIKYDYDETKVASISWSSRMNEMSVSEITEEIKY